MAEGAGTCTPSSGRRPCLFLDVDGVLHKLRLEFKDGKLIDDHCFQPECMHQLQRVVQQTGAEIVLSSSWRCYEGPREQLTQALQPYGLSFKRWTTTYGGGGEAARASQILSFVEEHAREVGNWAVVDDEQVPQGEGMMMAVLAARFVRTDGSKGLTADDADRLIALLNAPEDEEDDDE